MFQIASNGIFNFVIHSYYCYYMLNQFSWHLDDILSLCLWSSWSTSFSSCGCLSIRPWWSNSCLFFSIHKPLFVSTFRQIILSSQSEPYPVHQTNPLESAPHCKPPIFWYCGWLDSRYRLFVKTLNFALV